MDLSRYINGKEHLLEKLKYRKTKRNLIFTDFLLYKTDKTSYLSTVQLCLVSQL